MRGAVLTLQPSRPRIERRLGHGIGLVISRNLLERMGGRLVARSVPGVGSTFTLQLPAAAIGASVAVPVPRAAEVVGTRHDVRGSVIYIDDDEVNRLRSRNSGRMVRGQGLTRTKRSRQNWLQALASGQAA